MKLFDETPKGPKALTHIIEAALISRPDFALPEVYNFLRSPPNVQRFILVSRTLSVLRDPRVHAQQAAYQLTYAKELYPKLPVDLALELYTNRNETLLLFLVDAVRDYRVPAETREVGLKAAQLLKEKALPGLYRIVRTDDPANENITRLNALDIIWDIGGTQTLAKSLQALPPTGTYWPDGVEFRAQVVEFCQNKLAPDREKAGPILESLVDDPNWVTRAYALECIVQLYERESAIELLTPLIEDDQVLLGWEETGESTIGAYVKAFIDKSE